MNAIVPAGQAGAVTVHQEASNPFLAYGNAATQQRLVGDMLKFSKGDYFAGLDQREIPIGTRFAANMDTLQVGWIRWEDNKPAEIQMGLVLQDYKPARRAELGFTDKEMWEIDDEGQPQDPWQFSNYLVLKDENGHLYTFTTASTGGRGAIGELCKVYGKEMRLRPNEFPVIELDVGKYQHSNKRYGWVKFPKFPVTGWVTKDIFADDPPLDGDATGEVLDEIDALEQAAQSQPLLAARAMSAGRDPDMPAHLVRTEQPTGAAGDLQQAVATGRFNQQQPGPNPAEAAAQQAAAPKRGRPKKEAAPAEEATATPAPTSSGFGQKAAPAPAASGNASAPSGSAPRF